MRIRRLAAVCGVVMLTVPSVARGQSNPPSWVFVRDSAGNIAIVTNGMRVGVPIYPMEPAAVDAIPHTGRWMVPNEAGDNLTAAPRPDWDASASAPTAAAVAAPGGWSPVAQWSGRSDKMTEPVSISGRVWRISYSVRDAKYGNPQVCIQATRLTDGRLASNGCYHDADTTYVYSGAGIFALKISSNDEWSVTVEEQR